MNKLKQIINGFFADFTDKSAEIKKSSSWVREVWAASGVAFTGAASYMSIIKELSLQLIGQGGVFIQIIILIFGIFWSFVLICSKEKENIVGLRSTRNETFKYSYVQPVRIFGKLGLIVLLLFLLPRNIYTAYAENQPLPSTIYGIITEISTGKPIEGAKVVVTTSDGVDITHGNWLTDSRGFFIVETRTNISRPAYIQFFSSCTDSSRYPLSNAFEVSVEEILLELPKDTKPLFHYSLKCQAQ